MESRIVGERIYQARKEQHISQYELADRVQMTVATMSRYETGTIKNIKIPIVESIAIALNVNPLWLMGLSEDKKADGEKVLITKYRKLDAEGQQRLIEYLDMLLKKHTR